MKTGGVFSGGDSTEAQITRLNKDTGARFVHVREGLFPRLAPEILGRWSDICLKLADAGWHAFETTDAYLALSPALGVDGDRLIAVGEYGLGLAGYSFEPGRTYFQGVADFVGTKERPAIELIEQQAGVVIARFPQASNLLADYLRTAFLVGQQQNIEELSAWLEISIQAASGGRQELLDFLAGSARLPATQWRYIHSLFVLSESGAMAYLRSIESFGSRYMAIESKLQALCLAYLERGDDITVFLDSLANQVRQIGPDQVSVLMSLLEMFEHPELATAFVSTIPQLPLNRPAILASWLETGLEETGSRHAASQAFLKLQSARATELLEMLQGQVRLSEEKRVLQLFAEALSGVRLPLEASDPESPLRGLPGSDGLKIQLPEVVGFFPNRAENFSWLKIALCHQLASHEFGTFEFRYKDAYTAFEAYFAEFVEPGLAEMLFRLCEAARLDWQIVRRYPGLKQDMVMVKNRAVSVRQAARTPRQLLLEMIVLISLDGDERAPLDTSLENVQQQFAGILKRLSQPDASVETSMQAMTECYDLVGSEARLPGEKTRLLPIAYRGQVALDDASINLQLAVLDEEVIDFAEEEDGVKLTGMAESNDVNFDELKKGEVTQPSAVVVADGEMDLAEELDQVEEPFGKAKFDALKAEREAPAADQVFQYDEWDFNIQDYRRRWCTLYEIRQLEQDVDYVPNTLADHRALAVRVRKQLNMLRPELLRKVKGMDDGEELDLERAIESVVDRRSGVSPAENIYVQRQRRERDVSALFLLDMSASTDDVIDPVSLPTEPVMDDFLHDGFESQPHSEKGKTILDLEKQSVILMAEALEGLGDAYAVCGFSGYGRDKVEYYVCKDFDEPYNYRAKGNIGGIKPCRSTRMGPAIRHATKMLGATESRIKALIILSDGYPQDYDYGDDRNSRNYGIKDTTRALTEASLAGVQSFCLTVDPSGHDYLREMCPDQQYMVMQDIVQLPDELSKVYRGLTT